MRRASPRLPTCLLVLALSSLLGACGGAGATSGDTTPAGATPAGGRLAPRDVAECGEISALPPDDAWLTCVTAGVMQAELPWWQVLIVADREILLVSGENRDDRRQVFLDNLAARAADAPNVDALVDLVLDFAGNTVASIDESAMEATPRQVRAVLKPLGWAADVSAQQRGPSPIAAVPFVADIEVVFVIDLPSSMQMLTLGSAEDLGIAPADLPGLAYQNMTEALPTLPFERHPEEASLFVLTAGDAYDASRLLLPALWSEARRAVRGDLLVAAPSRDLVYFTGSETPGGPEALREWAERGVARGDYVISPEILRWTESGFVPASAPAAPPP